MIRCLFYTWLTDSIIYRLHIWPQNEHHEISFCWVLESWELVGNGRFAIKIQLILISIVLWLLNSIHRVWRCYSGEILNRLARWQCRSILWFAVLCCVSFLFLVLISVTEVVFSCELLLFLWRYFYHKGSKYFFCSQCFFCFLSWW